MKHQTMEWNGLMLSNRAVNVMRTENVRTFDDALRLGRDGLIALRNLGPITADEILGAIQRLPAAQAGAVNGAGP
jgi:hypothetical protein